MLHHLLSQFSIIRLLRGIAAAQHELALAAIQARHRIGMIFISTHVAVAGESRQVREYPKVAPCYRDLYTHGRRRAMGAV